MKKFPQQKEKGNMGEAIFESLITPHAIPHKIDASKDTGIDYLCEWKNGSIPTGIMFAAQVKYYESRRGIYVDTDYTLNLLDRYRILPTISINQNTRDYWKLIGMPCFLFVVIPNGDSINMFYKRYTPILTANASQFRSPFYKVNNNFRFLAFGNDDKKIGGFIRDLYIDQMRSNYSKGMISYLNPRKLGLMQFTDEDKGVFFKDIFQEYRANFEETFGQLKTIMDSPDEAQAVPSQAPPDGDDD